MGIRNLIGPRRRLVEALLSEFDEEMADTRKLLECVPDDKLAWKPHEKSFTLGKLANHLAALPVMATFLITGRPRKPSDAASKAEYLEAFDRNVAEFREALSGTNDDRLAESLLVSPGVSKTRGAALRRRGLMNHSIHHRGQLSVYLRLLDVPVPGIYGPSADEK
jgi:uncharacterized damage-inducible protein DinB